MTGASASVRFVPARCGMEVPCPRASRAAMIAASLFGLRRSGTRERHVGSGLSGPQQ